MEERSVLQNIKCNHAGYDLKLSIWDNDNVVEEVLGDEDTYRIKDLVARASVSKAVVVDLGANVGTFTLAMALRGAQVISVEADWETYILLLQNILNNECEERCHPINAFVEGAAPVQEFQWKGPKSFAPPLTVDARLWELPEFKDCYPRIVKMDIEGWEHSFFERPRAVGFLAMAQYVLMEWHCYDGHIYKEALEMLGFTVELTGCGNPAPPYDLSFARGMLYARK